jgi:hypothetical protein
MAKVSIVRADNLVYVNGEAQTVDCSHLPSYFHAIQWYGDAKTPYGEIEFAEDAEGKRMPNTRFSDFAPYAYLQDGWDQAKAAKEQA